MKNYVKPGDVVTITAPVGGIKSGEGYLVGEALYGVAIADAEALESAELATRGVFVLPKEEHEFFQGDPVYARYGAAPGTKVTIAGSGETFAQPEDVVIGVAASDADELAAAVEVLIR